MKIVLQILTISLMFWRITPATAADQAALIFHTGHGDVPFQVEVARTAAAQEYGLMNRTSMPQNAGMLFVFIPPRQISMWMKDTLIPLDIVFITGGKVTKIAPQAKPEDETAISSLGPINAVVEINGGAAARIGLKAGDTVSYEEK